MNTRAHIVVFAEKKEQSSYGLEPGEYVVGRHPDCPVQVNASGVSRQHARLTIREDGTLLVEDLGSSMGTWLDGVQLNAPTVVKENQSIQVGAATLFFELPAPEEAAVEPPSFEISSHTRYELGPEIARGGMGGVYAAWQPAIHREVALKAMLRDAGARDRLRFIQEAQITGQLEHPNIVPVHGLALDEEGKPYYTMKLVRGRTLADILKRLAEGDATTREKYPLSALLMIFQKVCDAIAFAHAKGILHRDLKPANIMAGDYGEVLVMDWGLGKRFNAECRMPNAEISESERAKLRPSSFDIRHSPTPAVTIDGAIIGTPQDMSPEQARGEVEDLDGRSDIYALGEILFQILHLRPAYTGRNPGEVIEKVGRGAVEWWDARSARVSSSPAEGGTPMETAKRTRSARSTIPDSLAAVVRKALAFERDQRYWTVEELQADLTAYQSGFATSAENAGPWKQFTLLIARHKGVSLAAACTLLLIMAIGALFTGRLLAERDATAILRKRALDGERNAREINAQARQESEKADEQERHERAAKVALLKEQKDDQQETERAKTASANAAKERDRAKTAKAEAEKATADAVEARKAAEKIIYFLQHDLRASLGKLGRLNLMEGVDTRIREYEEKHPLSGSEMRETAASFEKQGEVLDVQGHLPEALQEYREAQAIRRQLVEKDPNNPSLQYELYLTTKETFVIHQFLGQVSEAQDCYQQAVAILAEFARKEPNNPRWRNEWLDLNKKLNNALKPSQRPVK